MKQRKIYLAAMFSSKDLRKEQTKKLEQYGHLVTSRWVNETVPHSVSMKDLPAEYHKETCQADIIDITVADLFIMFVPTPDELINVPLSSASRGGRHCEMGFAYAQGKDIWVVGHKENVFHYMNAIKHFASFEEVLERLKNERN